jgi:hypothetical protein
MKLQAVNDKVGDFIKNRQNHFQYIQNKLLIVKYI